MGGVQKPKDDKVSIYTVNLHKCTVRKVRAKCVSMCLVGYLRVHIHVYDKGTANVVDRIGLDIKSQTKGLCLSMRLLGAIGYLEGIMF